MLTNINSNNTERYDNCMCQYYNELNYILLIQIMGKFGHRECLHRVYQLPQVFFSPLLVGVNKTITNKNNSVIECNVAGESLRQYYNILNR